MLLFMINKSVVNKIFLFEMLNIEITPQLQDLNRILCKGSEVHFCVGNTLPFTAKSTFMRNIFFKKRK